MHQVLLSAIHEISWIINMRRHVLILMRRGIVLACMSFSWAGIAFGYCPPKMNACRDDQSIIG
ncbi:hypothetical protein F2P45_16945 [Massilia sp. CCM 8733]|uniref:Uncharacterized protein n=1 Tax=Massilia mucilaginosa TaxID=2609282 RepID=A0ABX0NVD6_9BURK|nr:hypothetical protein [Massilia mucilaginosa]NHZ90695.1 hypothetical protein [Massilia mucilaginosa]